MRYSTVSEAAAPPGSAQIEIPDVGARSPPCDIIRLYGCVPKQRNDKKEFI